MANEPACLGAHPDLFFDDRYADVAKALCGTCGMQSNCLIEGILEEAFGVWGGMTGRERSGLNKSPDDSIVIEINWE
jgi:hypothetical protein